MKYTVVIALIYAVMSNISTAFAQVVDSDPIIELAKAIGKLEQQNKQKEEDVKNLDNTLQELQSNVTEVKTEAGELKGYFAPADWPHAINCGTSRDMLFILHASPTSGDVAWYVQVYPNEYRYVRFNADGSYLDRAGADVVSIGCNNKSIEQLRKEHKTYEAILDSVPEADLVASTLDQSKEQAFTLFNVQTTAACSQIPMKDAKNLYRLYKDPYNHFYTIKEGDVDLAQREGYKLEGSIGYAFATQVPGTVPLYRLYLVKGADHFYTIDPAQRDEAINKHGYNDEGIEAYVYKTDALPGCLAPFYRSYNVIISDHFYTTDSVEHYKAVTLDGYTGENDKNLIEAYVVIDPEAVKKQKKPVIIVGGTYSAEPIYWPLEFRLKNSGYFYRFMELPKSGSIDIHESARVLKGVVDATLRDTGASKVHLIGHSQGSLVARTYIHDYSGEKTVDSMISLSGPNKGTEFLNSDVKVLLGCPGAPPCEQMKPGSDLLKEVNGEPHQDIIYYTNFANSHDLLVTPLGNAFMDNCNRKNDYGQDIQCNILVDGNEGQCPNKYVEHISMATDAVVFSGIVQALRHDPIQLNCNAIF